MNGYQFVVHGLAWISIAAHRKLTLWQMNIRRTAFAATPLGFGHPSSFFSEIRRIAALESMIGSRCVRSSKALKGANGFRRGVFSYHAVLFEHYYCLPRSGRSSFFGLDDESL